LRHDLAVGLDVEHAVKKDEELIAQVSLFDKGLATCDAAPDELRALAEDRAREPALELRLDSSSKGRRAFVSPGRAVAELELGRPYSVDDPTAAAVERGAGKRAGPAGPGGGRPAQRDASAGGGPGKEGPTREVRSGE